MQIVIPCKSLQGGKSRLSSCLAARPRHDLCCQMLAQTLECALSVAAATNITVLTSDAEAAAIAGRYSAAVTPDPGMGLNAALEVARNAFIECRRADDSLLILPIDLPFATPSAIDEAHERRGDVVIASDQAGSGTNVLLLRGGAVARFGFRYGPDSYALHLRQARDNGLTICQVDDCRLAFDIDEPEQYAAWRSRTAECL